MAVDTVPDGFPVLPILATAQGNELFAFLSRAFGAELVDRYDTPDGSPAYMTIRVGDSLLSVMQPLEGGQPTRSAFYAYVADIEGTYRRAIEAGAKSVQEPRDAIHGDRMATLFDAFGNQWTIATRVEQISVEELHRRLARTQPEPCRADRQEKS